MKRVKIYISGTVQGVFYRASLQKEAQRLNINGHVRNLSDGRVEAVLEGEDSKVNQLLKWCMVGPKYAKVDKIEELEENYKGDLKIFTIL